MARGFKITGAIKGAKKFAASIEGFKKEVLARQVDAVRESTILIHNLAVSSIQDSSGGRPQLRYKPKRTVVASPPGKPPNTDTGRLAQSIKLDFQKGGLIGRVGTNLKYGKYLEFGTKRVEPRPWLSFAVKEASKEIGKIFRDAVKNSRKEAEK